MYARVEGVLNSRAKECVKLVHEMVSHSQRETLGDKTYLDGVDKVEIRDSEESVSLLLGDPAKVNACVCSRIEVGAPLSFGHGPRGRGKA